MNPSSSFQFNVLWLDDESSSQDQRYLQLKHFLDKEIQSTRQKIANDQNTDQVLYCNDARIQIEKRSIDLLTSKGLNPSYSVDG
ncbi:hypothetical protein MJH12_11660, partial [bacterium]|nr:hypothetical protein [bacterium]